MEFSMRWISWITRCISVASISVLALGLLVLNLIWNVNFRRGVFFPLSYSILLLNLSRSWSANFRRRACWRVSQFMALMKRFSIFNMLMIQYSFFVAMKGSQLTFRVVWQSFLWSLGSRSISRKALSLVWVKTLWLLGWKQSLDVRSEVFQWSALVFFWGVKLLTVRMEIMWSTLVNFIGSLLDINNSVASLVSSRFINLIGNALLSIFWANNWTNRWELKQFFPSIFALVSIKHGLVSNFGFCHQKRNVDRCGISLGWHYFCIRFWLGQCDFLISSPVKRSLEISKFNQRGFIFFLLAHWLINLTH